MSWYKLGERKPEIVEPFLRSMPYGLFKTAKDYTEIGHYGRKHVLWQSRDGVNIEKSGKEWEDKEDGHSEWTNKIGIELYEGRYDIETQELSVVSADYREIPQSLINNLLRAFPNARTLYIYTASHGQPEVIRVASNNWYKKAQTDYPYSLLEKIKMEGEKGLSVNALYPYEIEEAKSLENNGFIDKVLKQDKNGKYLAYVINKDKFEFMGWKT